MRRRSGIRGLSRTGTTRGGPWATGAARALTGLIVAAAMATMVSGQSAAIPPPPPNPSDSDIAQADTRVRAQLGAVGDLINQVASANAQLRELDDAVAVKREEVNKALVDLQNARDAADVAADAVGVSQQALGDAGTQIQHAQQRFDVQAAKTYTDGNGGAASIASYFGATSPDDVLDRAQLLELISQSQHAVLDSLQRARTEVANRNSSARKSKLDADSATAEAQSKQEMAEQAIDIAQSALQEQASRKAEIESRRDSTEAALDSARSNVAGLQNQREAYSSWDNQRQAEQAAIQAATDAARQVALQAAARVAANQAARDRAAELADGQRPHTRVDEDEDSADEDEESAPKKPRSKAKPATPTVTGTEAVETVIDRAMSQLGVRYSWGGGDENGPTKGIRDGGVGDSYGDYKKAGFDCSGLMIYAFAGIGISLPHYSGYQYTAGEQVPVTQMQRGDMLFWGANGSQHVALYLGDDQMVEAQQSGTVVKVSPVRESGMMPYAVRMVD